MNRFCLAVLCTCFVSPAVRCDDAPVYRERWFYAPFNLLVNEQADELIHLIGQAHKAGYNGLVLADYKLNILDWMGPEYFRNVKRVQKAAADARIDIIPAIVPVGTSDGLLAHDPNLAEGLPVTDAPFIVKGRTARLEPDPSAHMRNGDLEQTRGDIFVGFSYQDDPGKTTFADHHIKHGGRTSCRMEMDPKRSSSGNYRLMQTVKLRPHACYRFSCWIKTSKLEPRNGFQIMALGTSPRHRQLTFYETTLEPTHDWTRVDVVFNSLNESEVILYAGIWGGRSGTLWLDDLALEELSLVNVLRRPGCPFKVTSADGRTVYEEGKDFESVRDPKLGQVPYGGEYSFDHAGPSLRLTAHSRLHHSERLLVSWYHPVITLGYQVMCCLSEPKVYDILRDQARRVNDLYHPKAFLMSFDEIRVANWCHACQSRHQTPGELLADSARRCTDILHAVNPRAKVLVWSDMFDPYHNAVDHYYLVNGTLRGSWNGLQSTVVIANWNSGKATASLKWFADRGHRQIIAGYYDDGLDNLHHWNAAARNVARIDGFMYTTWQHQYRDLAAYGRALRGTR